ncbi:MAG: hypothetical protein U0905_10050 [Pirellulales bacterium]
MEGSAEIAEPFLLWKELQARTQNGTNGDTIGNGLQSLCNLLHLNEK